MVKTLDRVLWDKLQTRLNTRPVVALVGSRQVGKTTLAINLSQQEVEKPHQYLDLESDADLFKLTDPEDYLSRYEGELVIIDEVQRKPDLFKNLRGIVDKRKRQGETKCQFLLLGSASRDLIQQSSETLAGRISYLELTPFLINEVATLSKLALVEKLWLRGGFPDSYLAGSDEESWAWRGDFISTYLERDIPRMGPNLPAEKMKRLWTMLAHSSGQQLNLTALGQNLGVSHTTVRTYLDTLTDFYMLRQLQPWAGNVKKRLVKTPKVYLRDSGLLHRLLNIPNMETLLGHPVVGASWEGLVMESILSNLSEYWQYSYFRSSGQAEIDLVLEKDNEVWAVEIKRSTAPQLTRGFYSACETIGATRKFVVYPGKEQVPMKDGVIALNVLDFIKMVQ